MKTTLLFLSLSLTAVSAWAQPTWQCIIQTDDAPFMTSCDGQTPLDNHVLAFIYLDDNLNGPDTTDYTPQCIWVSGWSCIPEDPIFSFYNFPLQMNGTLLSPLFWGWGDFEGQQDSLHIYLRIFIGQNSDSCYTSPVIIIPDNDSILNVNIAKEQWTCGPSSVLAPRCHADRVWFEYFLPIPPISQCISTCNGGLVGIGVINHNLFRPPLLQLTAGCESNCEPVRSLHFIASNCSLLDPETSIWITTIIGQDVGCMTFHIIDSIPSARLDTMTAIIIGDSVELHWNTLWEGTLDSFQIWQPIPSGSNIDHYVASVLATNNSNGSEYTYMHNTAFSHGRSVAYLLVMIDTDGQEYPAGHIAVRGTQDVDDLTILSPSSFSLSAYPNPFNPMTNLSLTVPQTAQVKLKIYNVNGREVQALFEGRLEAGEHKFNFDGANLPSGLYFACLLSRDFFQTEKLLLLK